MGIKDVKNILLVLSGKGGVGKSSVAAHLACSLRDLNFKVGLLDVDLCGPSIPYLLDIEGKDVHKCSEGWMPVYTDPSQTLAVMSMGFFLNNRNDAVIWRGPRKNSTIKQFLTETLWQDLDYLVIDMPPGTSDEHITLAESMKKETNVGVILVTTPQMVAINDVMREITFCKKVSLPILGIIENMSGFVCPNCKEVKFGELATLFAPIPGYMTLTSITHFRYTVFPMQECSAVFSTGGGEALAKKSNLSFLGSIPLDPQFAASIKDRCKKNEICSTESLKQFQEISQTVINKMNIN